MTIDFTPIEILIVDDDRIECQIAKRMFKKARIINTIRTVNTGEEALDFLYKRNGFETMPTPDLIYLDLYMPSLQGTELLQYIHEDPQLSHIPVVMLTGSDNDQHIDLAREYGAVGYVIKPLDVRKIEETYLYCNNLQRLLVRV